ncbi:MAG: hypothetical protein JO102_04700, partial [Elusimicrobia bacterium]|nr:hypothetical protein [Elusimicrobiota bacterium]
IIVNAAVRTASLSLLGIPLLALAFVLPVVPAIFAVIGGVALSVVPHAVANGRVRLTRDERRDAKDLAALLHNLRAARADGDPARIADAIAALSRLEDLDLDHFGRERFAASRRSTEQFAADLERNESAFVDWHFATAAARRGRAGFTAGTVEVLTDDSRRRDHLGVVSGAGDIADLRRDTQESLRLADGRPLKVILTGAAVDNADAIKAEFSGRPVTFILESELSTSAEVEALLLQPALADAGKLKLLVQRGGGLPESLMRTLLELGRQDRYRDLVQLVLVATLENGGLGVQMTLDGLETMITFRQLVMTQA